MIQLALDEGVLLSPASDAHVLDHVGQLHVVETVLSDLGVRADQVLRFDHKR